VGIRVARRRNPARPVARARSLRRDQSAARGHGGRLGVRAQKGATPEQVAHLEKQLARWAAALAAAGRDVGDLPGAGAAGGLGAALLACGATLVPGFSELAHDAGALVVGLGGRVERPAPDPFDAVFPVHGGPRSLAEALDPEVTSAELRATAAEVVRLVLVAGR